MTKHIVGVCVEVGCYSLRDLNDNKKFMSSWAKECLQISLVMLSEFKQNNWLLFLLKSSENQRFQGEQNFLNIRSKNLRWSLKHKDVASHSWNTGLKLLVKTLLKKNSFNSFFRKNLCCKSIDWFLHDTLLTIQDTLSANA